MTKSDRTTSSVNERGFSVLLSRRWCLLLATGLARFLGGISRNALASGYRAGRTSEPGASALRLIELPGRFAVLLAAAVCLLGSPGCCTVRHWMAYSRPAAPEPCVLDPEATAEEIVNTLNDNVTKVYAWRSTDVKITARQGGVPIMLSAVMAVESPRKLRLIVRSFASDEVDLGSNPERFWFWMRRGDPHGILTASYDDVADGRPMGPIPFQPDWLIETLGVVPFSAAEFQMREQPGSQTRRVLFVADQVTPQGKRIQRTMLVDACQGVVLEHSLREPSGRLIARARLSNYQREPSGVRLPHCVDLHWPDSGVDLTMRMGHIEVNPSAISEQTWAMPSYPDAPVIDLTRFRP